jgi:CRP-like cAMP-binding protein
MSRDDSIKQALELKHSGRFEEAAQILREHLIREPRDVESRRELAEVLAQAGRADSAISEYVKVQEMLASHGDVLGAISAGLKVVEIDPRFENPLSHVAKVQTQTLKEEHERQVKTVPFVSVKPLTEIRLLSELDPRELSDVAKKMTAHKLKEGETVFGEADVGDSLFFVTRGLVVVTSGVQMLGQLGPGECFGEFSFLTGKPRTAAVRTIESTELLELSAAEMRSVVEAHPRLEEVLYRMYRERALVNVLAHSPLFDMLGVEDRESVAAQVELVTYAAGDTVFKRGEEGGAVYLVKRGSVEIRAMGPNEEEVSLAILRPHQFFGEVSFLTGVPRTATVIPLENCELLKLGEEALRQLVQDYPDLKQVLQSYHLDRVMATAETFKAFLKQKGVEGILH